ncbi:MAG: hypothetical protein WBX15_14480, partial [Thermoanaerobaculia bacterium]
QYDAENHLAKATLADGTTLENLYDANGRKVEEVVTSAGQTPQTTEYVLDGDQVLEEYVAGTRSARYVRGRGIDEIVRAEAASETLYPLQDELGNVDRLTDASGATLERYEYEGYGRFHIFDDSSTPQATSEYGWRWLFQGREYLPALDAYDFRARTLRVEMGRFGQEDPEGVRDSLNRYQGFADFWDANSDPFGLEMTPPEAVGRTPYGAVSGKEAHYQWDRWIAGHRELVMGIEDRTAFYDKSIKTIQRVARGVEGTGAYGQRRPDAARLDRVGNTITVWELKPQSYDPAIGSDARHLAAMAQLGMYIRALHPAKLGRALELHPEGRQVIGNVTAGDGGNYIMTAYVGEGSERGLVYYRLDPTGRKRERLLERTADMIQRTAPCVSQDVLAGAAIVGVVGAASAGTVGAVVGTAVAPVVGTVGLGVAGAGEGALGGAIVGAGIGLIHGVITCQ